MRLSVHRLIFDLKQSSKEFIFQIFDIQSGPDLAKTSVSSPESVAQRGEQIQTNICMCAI